MEKLTKEQIENASQISYDLGALSSEVKWDEASDFIKNIWRLRMVAAAPFLQCAPTEPGAPLTDEEWEEICQTLGLASSLWKKDKAKVDRVLARRTVRKEEPAKLDEDAIERACAAYEYAKDQDYSGTPGEKSDCMTAAARVIVQDRDAKWEKAIRADYNEGSIASADREVAKLRARIEAKPKTPEERVTVEEVHTTPVNYSVNCAFTAMKDGKSAGPLHSKREYAETYRLGLIAQLEQEEKERP